MSRDIQKICVFCASSQKSNQEYRDQAYKMGQLLARQGFDIIYGGGSIGSMGALADGALSDGGYVTGIIPEFMRELEVNHKQIQETIWVDTMHERKQLMIEKSDAVIGMPGGSGTLEELIEVITLKRLGIYLNPIIMVNTRGAFDPLEELLSRCISENFMEERHRDMWRFVDSPEKAIDAMFNAPAWTRKARSFAALKKDQVSD